MQNIGTIGAPGSLIRYYLSNDDRLNAGDTLLKQQATGAVKLGHLKKRTLSYWFPTDVSEAGQFIIVVMDAGEFVDECDEGNNVIVSCPLPEPFFGP